MNDKYFSNFLSKLTEKTKLGLINWRPLRSYVDLNNLLEELPDAYGFYIEMGVNSVKISDSYYLKHKNGYLFFLYIWHTSGLLNGSYFMLARIDEDAPL